MASYLIEVAVYRDHPPTAQEIEAIKTVANVVFRGHGGVAVEFIEDATVSD